jgi:hypothetical protein
MHAVMDGLPFTAYELCAQLPGRLEGHRLSAGRGFAAAIAALLGEFDAYLAGEGANPRADMVSYKQFSLWLSNDEKAAFIEELVLAIRRRMKHTPAPNRRRHMLSTILFPTDTLIEDTCWQALIYDRA